jgi:hypothetical protein
MDPWIRIWILIHTKMSWIRNIVFNEIPGAPRGCVALYTVLFLDTLHPVVLSLICVSYSTVAMKEKFEEKNNGRVVIKYVTH